MVPRGVEQAGPLPAPRLEGAEQLVEAAGEDVEQAAVAVGLHHRAVAGVNKIKPATTREREYIYQPGAREAAGPKTALRFPCLSVLCVRTYHVRNITSCVTMQL